MNLTLLLTLVFISSCMFIYIPPDDLVGAGAKGRGIGDISKISLDEAKEASNSFAFSIYSELRKSKGNIFFSPYSLALVLSQTYEGASGKTRSQMKKVLSIRSEAIHFSYKKLIDELDQVERKETVVLSTAFRLWGEQNYEFSGEYLSTLKKAYGSDLSILNFKNDPEGSREAINEWAESNTVGKIKDLIPKGVITELTRLVLTNAIYFKGDWLIPFDSKRTVKMPFTSSANKKVQKDFMFKKEKISYMENDTLQMVSIPFKGRDISFMIILPKDSESFAQVEKIISDEKLNEWIYQMRVEKVDLVIPKLLLEKEFKLKKTLSSLGMPLAFSDDADFSKMLASGLKDLKIDEVVHKAFLEINETGAEAAAASAVVMAIKGMSMPLVFQADRPFIFLIVENSTKTNLFLGRVVK